LIGRELFFTSFLAGISYESFLFIEECGLLPMFDITESFFLSKADFYLILLL